MIELENMKKPFELSNEEKSSICELVSFTVKNVYLACGYKDYEIDLWTLQLKWVFTHHQRCLWHQYNNFITTTLYTFFNNLIYIGAKGTFGDALHHLIMHSIIKPL